MRRKYYLNVCLNGVKLLIFYELFSGQCIFFIQSLCQMLSDLFEKSNPRSCLETKYFKMRKFENPYFPISSYVEYISHSSTRLHTVPAPINGAVCIQKLCFDPSDYHIKIT